MTTPIDVDGHVLGGEIKPNGDVVGGHSIASGKVRVVTGTCSTPNAQGVYKAEVEVEDAAHPGQWVRKTNNGGISTMFPDSWTAAQVKAEIDHAYQHKTISGNGMWTGTTPSGVRVRGFLSPKTTAYPIY